jgi:RNA polymerase sigma factor (sigma-70 family)
VATGPLSNLIPHLRQAVLRGEEAALTDGQLLEGFLSRREDAALEALVRRHGPMVWGVCRRLLASHHDAEDAFQATFLVLVRKAASIRFREAVANWLYGVARQTALKARAMAAKRRAREKQVAVLPEPAAAEPDAWHDLQPLLDQELSRLPGKYRLVLLLCDAQGQTRREAAAQLGLAEGTVASRLARARALLAKRLVRRGVVLTGGALAGLLAQRAAAGVPAAVVSATIRAASLFAAGQGAAAGGISAPVAALLKGVLRAMLLNQLKAVTAGLLLLGVAALACAVLARSPGDDKPGRTEEPAAQPKPAAQPEPAAQLKPAPEARPGPMTVPAGVIAHTYRTNEALADERFTGVPVAVTGKMIRVERSGILLTAKGKGQEKRVYVLLMSSGDPTDSLLSFRFTEDDRSQLAKLKEGRVVWVEGKPEGYTRNGAEGRDIIYFFDCKLLPKTFE